MCPNHVHMPVEILPKVSISSFMEYLKGNLKEKAVRCDRNNFVSENINIEIESFGVIHTAKKCR